MYFPLPAHRESPLLVVAPLLRYAPDFKQVMHLFPVTALYKQATTTAERRHRPFSLPRQSLCLTSRLTVHFAHTLCMVQCVTLDAQTVQTELQKTSACEYSSSTLRFWLALSSLLHPRGLISYTLTLPQNVKTTIHPNTKLATLPPLALVVLAGGYAPQTHTGTHVQRYRFCIVPPHWTLLNHGSIRGPHQQHHSE